MQEQIVYLIGNAFRVYIYWKLLNTIFCAAKVKQFWIIIGFMLYFLLNSSVAIMFENFTLNILTNIIPLIALSFLYESKVTSKLFVGLSFYVVNMLADGIVYTVILITKVDSIVMSSGIATVLVTFLIELIFEYVWKKRSYHEIDKLYLMTILAVPIGSILIGVLTMYQYSIKTIIVAFVLMSFNLLIFYMFLQYSEKNTAWGIDESYHRCYSFTKIKKDVEVFRKCAESFWKFNFRKVHDRRSKTFRCWFSS